MSVYLGTVRTFENAYVEKEQFVKILEEAAEIFGAWQSEKDDNEILMECADLIQATCNLIDAMGFNNMKHWMSACVVKNEAKGRKYK